METVNLKVKMFQNDTKGKRYMVDNRFSYFFSSELLVFSGKQWNQYTGIWFPILLTQIKEIVTGTRLYYFLSSSKFRLVQSSDLLLTCNYSWKISNFVSVNEDLPSFLECNYCPIELYVDVFGARHSTTRAAFYIIHEYCE